MNCKHLCDGKCSLFRNVIKADIPVIESEHCTVCSVQPQPQSLNYVTCSIAITYLHNNKMMRPEFHGLFTCVKEKSPLAIQGQELWKELHEKEGADALWFADWFSRVPNIDCGCQESALKILQRIPVVYGEGWFAWTVLFHNEVNLKLNKRTWSLDEAWRKWKACNCLSKKCS